MESPETKPTCCIPQPGRNDTCTPRFPAGALEKSFQTEIACCGGQPSPASSAFERPGYRLLPFVSDFLDTPVGPVPRVKTSLEHVDRHDTLKARIGIARHRHAIAPGLYATGTPGTDSPVLVTANYKLTFDALRRELAGVDAWILVIDTRGINVWCAAGKGTFAAEEVSHRIRQAGLDQVVRHRHLVLPQLSAPGVDAREIRQRTGFRVLWGPVRAADLPDFIAAGFKAGPAMRQVTFTLAERLVLVPVELTNLKKATLWVLPALFLLSGVGGSVFSLHAAWHRGLLALAAYATGVLAGALVAPALLPWIPGHAFSLKGAFIGLVISAAALLLPREGLSPLEAAALMVFAASVSSYLSMNFTGSTPFTSPSGVEKEMRRAIPLQAAGLLAAAIVWVIGGFSA